MKPAASEPGTGSLPSGWVQAYDATRQATYYCNVSLGITQWHHPVAVEGSLPQEDDKEEELFTGEGLYYRDASMELQGPFTMEQVQAWRPFLPMDLPCWIFDAEDFQAKKEAPEDPSKGDIPDPAHTGLEAPSEKVEEGQGRKRRREGGSAAENIKAMVAGLITVTPSVKYAELLGDSALLADYREVKCEGRVPESLAVPSAVQWERAMIYGLDHGGSQSQGTRAQQGWRDEAAAFEAQEAQADDDGLISGSSLSYAEAVLSALPEDDEAVQLSRGASLKQVIMYGVNSAQASGVSRGVLNEGPPSVEVDFSAAQRNPLNGKLTAVGSTGPSMRNHLYGELARYANPEDIERQMTEAAAQRGKALPQQVWKKLKERRLEIKKKMKIQAFEYRM